MPSTDRMTFSIPKPLKKRAQKRRDVNWSAVVARAVERKLAELELADRIASRSKLTSSDVAELSDIIDAAMSKHFGAKV